MNSKLYIVIPCYNEEKVLPVTAPLFSEQLNSMKSEGLISADSKILFVDDGSRDNTWQVIKELNEKNKDFIGIRQSRNRGHQNAVLAGLMEAKDKCDITISIDCDGQDDIKAMTEMVKEYNNGCEIVYGVRSERKTDTFFKRATAQGFYKLLNGMGAEVVYNHADYRLVSSRVLSEFADFKEVNLFLRGMFPLVGFKSTSVYYERKERMAGESHYPLSKMVGLAIDGITSMSTKPLKLVFSTGTVITLLSIIGIICAVIRSACSLPVLNWEYAVYIVCAVMGIGILCLGVTGEYIGKIYSEVKARPRYIISERID